MWVWVYLIVYIIFLIFVFIIPHEYFLAVDPDILIIRKKTTFNIIFSDSGVLLIY